VAAVPTGAELSDILRRSHAAEHQPMNSGLHHLQPYPFERLAGIKQRVAPAAGRNLIDLSIGEPQHPTPACIRDALIEALDGTARYPATRGISELRETICDWANQRFKLEVGQLTADAHVLPVNGTREALFSIAQVVVNAVERDTLVGMPNPFYQIYEGAALLAGAEPYYLPCPAENGFLPHWDAVPAADWQKMSMVYICSPSNPAGSVFSDEDYARLVGLADEFNFIIVADECYSEIYFDERVPPKGLLQWCSETGRISFARCLVMHSLSKRSNAPGLRSGFVAGDADLIRAFYQYRTYQGGAMPLHVQHASIAAWRDEVHVRENRALYRTKFEKVTDVLSGTIEFSIPAAGFYLWPELDIDGVSACERLLGEAGVLVLPGAFLARETDGINPGDKRVRIALVADERNCVVAAERMRDLLARG